MPKKQDYLVGLDLGSSRSRCVVAFEEDSRLRFIAYGVADVAPDGWERGRISNPEAVLESVEKAVEQAERNGGMLVEASVVGVGGDHLQSNVSHAAVNLNSWEGEIERKHVEEAVRRAAQGPLSEERTVLQAIPIEFEVDQQAAVRNPLGMSGRRLDSRVQVISALAQAHDTIRATVNRAGVVVEETIAEVFAAGYAALEEQEREIGVAVVDLGAQSADIAVYLDNDLQFVSAISIGGDHFVGDVATILRTSKSDARALMEQYGNVLPDQTPPNVMIEAPSLTDGRFQEHPRRLLNQILEARAEELFELIGAEIDRVGLRNRLVGGLVLTGSLACMAGGCDLAERVLSTNARIGLPPRIEDLPDELDHPGWATSIGLVLYAQRLRLHQKRKRDKMTEWLKTLFD
jgi:cell division protein FtsA